jgi:DNA-directed RNA polymerase subunit RPC12/RpoP
MNLHKYVCFDCNYKDLLLQKKSMLYITCSECGERCYHFIDGPRQTYDELLEDILGGGSG